MYLRVNKVEKELWLPTLITAVGDEAYELLSSFSKSCKPADSTYDAAMASALEAAERDSASVDASGGMFAGKMGTVHSVKAKRRSREQVSVGAKFERCVACGVQ
ncbi:hypothetical protein ACJJTC_008653 [Scirpophaga incertulas]